MPVLEAPYWHLPIPPNGKWISGSENSRWKYKRENKSRPTTNQNVRETYCTTTFTSKVTDEKQAATQRVKSYLVYYSSTLVNEKQRA